MSLPPPNLSEPMRIAALRSYAVLDTAPEPAFDDVVQLAARLTGSPVAALSLVDRGRVWLKARHGIVATQMGREGSFCAQVILDPGRPLLIGDARQDSRFAEDAAAEPGLVAYAGVALQNPEGHALGSLFVMDRAPRNWTEAEAEDLQRLARLAGAALEARRLGLRAGSLALTDPGTGLPNRRALLDLLGRALARQRRDAQPVTVLSLGLSGPVGVSDGLLDCAASALLQCIRAEDMPGRIGESSFAAVLVGGDGAEGAVVGERLRTALLACIEADGQPATPSVAAICLMDPPDEDEEEVLEMVEAMLEETRAAGTGRVACREMVTGR
ncbi:MAG TPA: GAF domain-containing protein [Acetobacteraceae bacterium]|nr:GAF domain-containing protein [Acetobacteraceae bacterium]